MCKICWSVSAVLAVITASMVYMFVIRGSVADSGDGRTAILLTAGERNLVLNEMRGFLESVQAITEGAVNKDMKAVYESAHNVGMANAGQVPASLMGKLPMEFKSLGMATHKAFDDLAMEAKDLGNQKIVLTKLSSLLNNCTTCHAGYRLQATSSKGK